MQYHRVVLEPPTKCSKHISVEKCTNLVGVCLFVRVNARHRAEDKDDYSTWPKCDIMLVLL